MACWPAETLPWSLEIFLVFLMACRHHLSELLKSARNSNHGAYLSVLNQRGERTCLLCQLMSLMLQAVVSVLRILASTLEADQSCLQVLTGGRAARHGMHCLGDVVLHLSCLVVQISARPMSGCP